MHGALLHLSLFLTAPRMGLPQDPSTDCSAAPQGSFAGRGSYECEPCAPGTHDDDGKPETACVACPALTPLRHPGSPLVRRMHICLCLWHRRRWRKHAVTLVRS